MCSDILSASNLNLLLCSLLMHRNALTQISLLPTSPEVLAWVFHFLALEPSCFREQNSPPLNDTILDYQHLPLRPSLPQVHQRHKRFRGSGFPGRQHIQTSTVSHDSHRTVVHAEHRVWRGLGQRNMPIENLHHHVDDRPIAVDVFRCSVPRMRILSRNL
jgi:hypothetical protein